MRWSINITTMEAIYSRQIREYFLQIRQMQGNPKSSTPPLNSQASPSGLLMCCLRGEPYLFSMECSKIPLHPLAPIITRFFQGYSPHHTMTRSTEYPLPIAVQGHSFVMIPAPACLILRPILGRMEKSMRHHLISQDLNKESQ